MYMFSPNRDCNGSVLLHTVTGQELQWHKCNDVTYVSIAHGLRWECNCYVIENFKKLILLIEFRVYLRVHKRIKKYTVLNYARA